MRFKINGIEKTISHTPGKKIAAVAYNVISKMAGFKPLETVIVSYYGGIVRPGQFIPVEEGMQLTVEKLRRN